MKNYYSILGLPDFMEIRNIEIWEGRAIKKASKMLSEGQINIYEYQITLEEIQDACDVFNDSDTKKEYDNLLRLYVSQPKIARLKIEAILKEKRKYYLDIIDEAEKGSKKEIDINYFITARDAIKNLNNIDLMFRITDIIKNLTGISNEDGYLIYETTPSRFKILSDILLRVQENEPIAREVLVASMQCGGIRDLRDDKYYEKALKYVSLVKGSNQGLLEHIDLARKLRDSGIDPVDATVDMVIDQRLDERNMNIDGKPLIKEKSL